MALPPALDPLHPEPGESVVMPDGQVVDVASSAQDHTGYRVNGLYLWRAPDPPATFRPGRAHSPAADPEGMPDHG